MYVFPITGIIGGALYSCYNYFYVILNGGVGKNGSTVAVSQHAHISHSKPNFLIKRGGPTLWCMLNNIPSVQDTSVLTPGLHIGLILTLAFIIFKKSSSHLFENHPCLYLLAFGMVISKISNKLVVGPSCYHSYPSNPSDCCS